ncbi:DUF2314 domain-containing protein [Brevibacillus sp. NPDC055896]
MKNTGSIHGVCAEERKRKLQNDPLFDKKLKESKYVKCAFSQTGKVSEHMWVRIIELDDSKRKLKGILDNDPQHLTNVKCGDLVEVKYAEVEQFL